MAHKAHLEVRIVARQRHAYLCFDEETMKRDLVKVAIFFTDPKQSLPLNLNYGATAEEVRAAQVKINAKIKDDNYYQEIIEGKRRPLCATEVMIAKTKTNAGMVLAYVGINHSAFEIVFKYFVAQNYPDLKRRFLLPHLNF